MPVRLKTEDREFILRVHAYCEAGLTEPEMAARESMVLTTFRNNVFRCGFLIAKQTERRLVRTGSGESFVEMLACGEIVPAEEPQAAAS
jgi:hypothetical protein